MVAAQLAATRKPLEAAQSKQAQKRTQLAECLQEIERLRQEDARLSYELGPPITTLLTPTLEK